EKRSISLRQPWKTLTPYFPFEQASTFKPQFAPPWPDLVIAGGRKAVAACRYIKRKNPKAFIVFLQNPKIRSRVLDLIAAPAHDKIQGQNIISTLGAANYITDEKLQSEKQKFAEFAALKTPRV